MLARPPLLVRLLGTAVILLLVVVGGSGEPNRPAPTGNAAVMGMRFGPLAGARLVSAGAAPPTTAQCKARSHVACYGVAQVQTAYDLSPLFHAGYTGTGRTIAVMDLYGSPTISRDLAAFDAAMHLSAPPRLTVIQPAGPVPPYRASGARPGWALETSLDVEWAHAIAPGAAILLVEAPTPGNSDGTAQIVAAERYVIDHHLADVISQSFGTAEPDAPRPEVMSLRSVYVDAQQHHVSVLAATGDQGATQNSGNGGYFMNRVSSWPATDPLVTAVGGTELHLDASGRRTSPDTAWNDTYLSHPPAPSATGGGLSVYFPRPYFQNGVAGVVGNHRGVPDIAMSAANSGSVLVYASFPGVQAGWYPVGGTSEATPLFAAVVAIADQYAGADLGLINPALYSMYYAHATGLVDVTRGNNTVSFTQGGTAYTVVGYPARARYDLVSGVGTINAGTFVPELAATAPYVRTISYTYANPCSVTVHSPTGTTADVANCPTADTITVQPSDRYLTVSIVDATGSPVPFSWGTSGISSTAVQVICGATRDMRVAGGSYTLAPAIPVGDPACPLPATKGTVTVRLSNYP